MTIDIRSIFKEWQPDFYQIKEIRIKTLENLRRGVREAGVYAREQVFLEELDTSRAAQVLPRSDPSWKNNSDPWQENGVRHLEEAWAIK